MAVCVGLFNVVKCGDLFVQPNDWMASATSIRSQSHANWGWYFISRFHRLIWIFPVCQQQYPADCLYPKKESLHFRLSGLDQLSIGDLHDIVGYLFEKIFSDPKTLAGIHVHRHWGKSVYSELLVLAGNHPSTEVILFQSIGYFPGVIDPWNP